jgi:hypothetical protein
MIEHITGAQYMFYHLSMRVTYLWMLRLLI